MLFNNTKNFVCSIGKQFDNYLFELGKVTKFFVTPQLCLKRIKKRARKGEENISLEYLHKLKQLHDAFIKEKKEPKIFLTHKETLEEWCRKVENVVKTKSKL